jgi:hypothetical protein
VELKQTKPSRTESRSASHSLNMKVVSPQFLPHLHHLGNRKNMNKNYNNNILSFLSKVKQLLEKQQDKNVPSD